MRYINQVLADRIDQKLAVIQHMRPLPVSAVEKLRQQFALEMTYNSNAIEGNRLSLKETFLVISEGITIKGRSLKDHLEAKDHYDAMNFLFDFVEKDQKHELSEIFIRNIHQIIMKGTDPDWAGRYRNGNVVITGSTHKPCSPFEIAPNVGALISWAKENKQTLHPVELAALVHHKVVYIHPFFDGNGRTCRLIMNLLLMQEGYPLVIILKNDRRKYYRVLEQADKGNHLPLVQFIAQSVERSLNMYIKALAPMTQPTEDFILLAELSKLSTYSTKYLNLLARTGKIEAYKEKRNWLSSKEALERYISSRQRKRR